MPAFAAEQGFLEGASESENAAPGMSTAFGVGQMLIVGVTMVLTAVGSGLFVVL
jgi:hypothetical protein